MTERNNTFLGTYFDRDAVIRMAKVMIVQGFFCKFDQVLPRQFILFSS